MKVNEKYLGRSNALIKYGISPNLFPTFKEVWKKSDASRLINDGKWEIVVPGDVICTSVLVF